MNEVLFLKGEDVTVTADGVTLGGVTAAECGERTEWETYGEILTDIPVARYGKTVYIIKLTLNAQPYGSLGLSPGTVTLSYGDTEVVYTGCRVEQVKCEIMPRETVRYVVTLAAEERSESHE